MSEHARDEGSASGHDQRSPAAEGRVALTGPVVLVTSPHAGRGEQAEHLTRQLEAAGVQVGMRLLVSDLDQQRSEGTRWREAGMIAGIAAGGDGTIGAVVSHLAGSGLPLGILPVGTANDTARSLYLPLDLPGAIDAIAHGVPVPIDAGHAVPAMTEPGAIFAPGHAGASTSQGTPPGAYFMHTLTLGLNVEFARLATDVARRERWGGLTYAASALEAVTSYRPLPVTLRFAGVAAPHLAQDAEDVVVTCHAVQITAVNLPVFGGTLNLRVPGVATSDRLLDFVILEALEGEHLRAMVEELLGAVGRLGETLRGRIGGRGSANAATATPGAASATTEATDEALGLALPGVRRIKARSMHIETTDPVALTLDGEVRATTPALVRVAPDPVYVLLPPAARDMLASQPASTSAESKG